jgi:hypothetical protein
MGTVKLSDIESMLVEQIIPKPERLAREFLEVFDGNRLLDQEEFEEWIQINALSAEDVNEAAREAVHRRWIEDTPDGLVLTETGRQQTEEDATKPLER